ncbi:MAG: hypothetical protein QXK07_06040 [Desulfurococcaceae archaeon]
METARYAGSRLRSIPWRETRREISEVLLSSTGVPGLCVPEWFPSMLHALNNPGSPVHPVVARLEHRKPCPEEGYPGIPPPLVHLEEVYFNRCNRLKPAPAETPTIVEPAKIPPQIYSLCRFRAVSTSGASL